jgi:protein-tyrosine phosphatase
MIQDTTLYWVEGPWPGKLALAARPRGGAWLDDEISSWQRAGVRSVVSLLTREEEEELDLVNEAAQVKAHRLAFSSFPISDRRVPDSEEKLRTVLEKIDRDLSAGKNVVLHCRQGIGRTGLVAACLLASKGVNAETALKQLSAIRGVPIPETTEQRQWIDHYTSNLASAK